MPRMVDCVVLKRQAEGLSKPPYPGDLGKRIFNEVSKEGWRQWLDRLTIIINENGVNSADPRALDIVEAHMRGFLFGEGEMGQLPQEFTGAPRK